MAVFMPSIMDRAESGLLSIIISALVISFWVVRNRTGYMLLCGIVLVSSLVIVSWLRQSSANKFPYLPGMDKKYCRIFSHEK